MKKTAIIYASHDGHTQTICQTIKAHLAKESITVDVLNVDDCDAQTIHDYDVVIFGSAVRYGKHLRAIVKYLRAHTALLKSKQTAFFSVNLTARKANRNTPEMCSYIQKMLIKLDWQPDELDVFAGKLNYPSYNFFNKQIIRLIMKLTEGPTDLNTVEVFTDWARVEAFSERLKAMATDE